MTKKAEVSIHTARLVPIHSSQKTKKENKKKSKKREKKTEHSQITKLLTKLRKNKVEKQHGSLKKNEITKEDILDGVIVNQTRAARLISFLEKNKDTITWNNTRQAVLFDQAMAGTDFIDILNAILTPSARLDGVPGAFAFLQALKLISTPASLVVNTKAKRELQKK